MFRIVLVYGRIALPVIEPPPPCYTIEELGDSLRITVAGAKNCSGISLLGLWLVPWVIVEIVICGVLFSGLTALLQGELLESNSDNVLICVVGPALLAGFTFWTIRGVLAISQLVWQLSGREVIEVSNLSIKIQRQELGLGRPNEYWAEHIKDLRIVPGMYFPFSFLKGRAASFWVPVEGPIVFDYGARTVRFGLGVDEAEAKQILAAIQLRFPRYQSG